MMNMAIVRNRFRRAAAGLAVLAALAALAPAAHAMVFRAMSLDEIVEKSDAIFLATCEGKRTEFRNGNIMTIYTLRPSEFIKGKDAFKLSEAGTLESEQIGGSIAKGDLRLGQHFTAAFTFVPGEELLLFAKVQKINKALDDAGSPRIYTPGSVAIFDHAQGRLSVLTDPASGRKFVVRANLDQGGVMANERAMRIYLEEQTRKLGRILAEEAASGTADNAQALTEALEASAAADPRPAVGKPGAPKPSRAAIPAKGSEIRNFEPLSEVRDLVTGRMREIESRKSLAAPEAR